jgi:hypothetical protein
MCLATSSYAASGEALCCGPNDTDLPNVTLLCCAEDGSPPDAWVPFTLVDVNSRAGARSPLLVGLPGREDAAEAWPDAGWLVMVTLFRPWFPLTLKRSIEVKAVLVVLLLSAPGCVLGDVKQMPGI